MVYKLVFLTICTWHISNTVFYKEKNRGEAILYRNTLISVRLTQGGKSSYPENSRYVSGCCEQNPTDTDGRFPTEDPSSDAWMCNMENETTTCPVRLQGCFPHRQPFLQGLPWEPLGTFQGPFSYSHSNLWSNAVLAGNRPAGTEL